MSAARRIGAALLAGVLTIPGPTNAIEHDNSELTRLEEYTRQHPDDPDLAWAYIQALEEHALVDRAIAELETFVTRWPNRRSDAPILLGRLLYSRGRYAEALAALEEGIYREPRTGTGRVYRGLTLRALGRGDDAERELRVAAVIEPRLAAETLLLRAMARLENGEREEGQALLRQAIELDPTGETGRRAQFLLGPVPRPAGRSRLTLNAYTGVEIDTNVTVESGSSSLQATNSSDSRLVWGGGLQLRALEREGGSLSLGYSYSESAQEDRKTFNFQNHTVFSSATVNAGKRVRLRLDGLATDAHLDDQRYARSWTVRPNVFLTLGRRAGLSRVYGEVARINYHTPPTFPSLERDSTTYRGGLEHFLRLPFRKGAWLSLGGTVARTNTKASTDAFGLEGDYDNDATRSSFRVHLPLVWGIEADVSGAYTNTRYRNRNLVELLNTFSRTRRRHDREQQISVSLTRPLVRNTKLELRWSGIDHYSNIETYDYTRQIFGIYVRVQTN